MKKNNRIFTLLLALTTVLVMSQAAFAVSGGTFTFDGTDIVGDEAAQQEINITGLEPGDSTTFTFTYVNGSSEETNWYLSNDVLKTLEEGSDAEGGGYTYELVNDGVKEGHVVIFSSDAVAGTEDYDPDTADTGLHDAANALGEEEWIFIDTLQPGQKGTTTLTVALDGESQPNSYQSTDGQLEVAYAVETVDNTVTYKHVSKIVHTGDDTNLLPMILTFLGALALLILAYLSWRKDRKDGDEA